MPDVGGSPLQALWNNKIPRRRFPGHHQWYKGVYFWRISCSLPARRMTLNGQPQTPRSSCEPLARGSTRTKKHERLASFKTLRSKNRLFPARLDPFPGGLTLASCEFLDTTSNCPSITLPFLGGSVSPYRKLSRQWRYAIKARFPAAGTHYPHCRIQSLLGRRVSTKEGCWVAILPGSNAPNDPRCRMGDPSVCKSGRGEAYA